MQQQICFSCGKLRDVDQLSDCGDCEVLVCGLEGCNARCACDMKDLVDEAEEVMHVPAPLRPYMDSYKKPPHMEDELSLADLGQFAALLAKRALSRTTLEKREKDLQDAENYVLMMQVKIREMREPAVA